MIPRTETAMTHPYKIYVDSPAPTRKQRNEFRSAFGLPPLTRTPRKLKKKLKARARRIARDRSLMEKFLNRQLDHIAARGRHVGKGSGFNYY